VGTVNGSVRSATIFVALRHDRAHLHTILVALANGSVRSATIFVALRHDRVHPRTILVAAETS
jgi:hypothetical protein